MQPITHFQTYIAALKEENFIKFFSNNHVSIPNSNFSLNSFVESLIDCNNSSDFLYSLNRINTHSIEVKNLKIDIIKANLKFFFKNVDFLIENEKIQILEEKIEDTPVKNVRFVEKQSLPLIISSVSIVPLINDKNITFNDLKTMDILKLLDYCVNINASNILDLFKITEKFPISNISKEDKEFMDLFKEKLKEIILFSEKNASRKGEIINDIYSYQEHLPPKHPIVKEIIDEIYFNHLATSFKTTLTAVDIEGSQKNELTLTFNNNYFQIVLFSKITNLFNKLFSHTPSPILFHNNIQQKSVEQNKYSKYISFSCDHEKMIVKFVLDNDLDIKIFQEYLENNLIFQDSNELKDFYFENFHNISDDDFERLYNLLRLKNKFNLQDKNETSNLQRKKI